MLGAKNRQRPEAAKKFVLPDFLVDDIFALKNSATEASIPKSQSDEHYRAERSSMRKKSIILGVAVVVVFLLSLCISFDGSGTGGVYFYPPWTALSSLGIWIVYQISTLFHLGWIPEGTDLITIAPVYAQVVPRAGMTLATLVCGGLLACAGSLYQTVFRNPIASPSLLGITGGVKVGLLILFYFYGMSSIYLVDKRFIYGYTAGIITLVVVFALAKLITKRKTSISVFDILIIGTIAAAFLSAASKYIMSMLATVDMWTVFFEFQEGLDIYLSPESYGVLIVSVIISFIPVALMRFHLNLLSFSDGEARIMGGNPVLLRVLSIVGGSIMILTAQVFVGSASSFALVIPFIARVIFGCEFQHQYWGSMFIGMLALIICRDLCAIIPFGGVGIPIGTVAGIATLPIFIWITLFARKWWQ